MVNHLRAITHDSYFLPIRASDNMINELLWHAASAAMLYLLLDSQVLPCAFAQGTFPFCHYVLLFPCLAGSGSTSARSRCRFKPDAVGVDCTYSWQPCPLRGQGLLAELIQEVLKYLNGLLIIAVEVLELRKNPFHGIWDVRGNITHNAGWQIFYVN